MIVWVGTMKSAMIRVLPHKWFSTSWCFQVNSSKCIDLRCLGRPVSHYHRSLSPSAHWGFPVDGVNVPHTDFASGHRCWCDEWHPFWNSTGLRQTAVGYFLRQDIPKYYYHHARASLGLYDINSPFWMGTQGHNGTAPSDQRALASSWIPHSSWELVDVGNHRLSPEAGSSKCQIRRQDYGPKPQFSTAMFPNGPHQTENTALIGLLVWGPCHGPPLPGTLTPHNEGLS